MIYLDLDFIINKIIILFIKHTHLNFKDVAEKFYDCM